MHVTDVSEPHYLEKELTELLRSDAHMWQFLREGSLDGVWYWDLENPEHEWMSPEFWRLFGIDPETRKHEAAEWQDLIFPEDRDAALENFQKHCADPNHPYDQIVRYRHKDGSTVWVRCRGLAIRDRTGKPIRMLGAHNDLTAVKRAEEQARQSISRSVSSNKDLQAFLYAVSHDLRAPLNSVETLLRELEFSQHDRLDQDGRELLALARRSIERMQLLVIDLSQVSQIVSDDSEMAEMDLDELLEQAISNLSLLIEESGAEIAANPLPKLSCRAKQIVILFECLLSNSIKYAKPGTAPRIQIELAQTEPDGVVLAVSDQGIGIPIDKREEVFTMFRRLHRHEEIAGSGVGLALCRRIARDHGGDVTLSESATGGLRASVRLSLR